MLRQDTRFGFFELSIPEVVELDAPGVDEPDDGRDECIQKEDVGFVEDESALADDVAGDEEVDDETDECGVDEECGGLLLREADVELGFVGDLLEVDDEMVCLADDELVEEDDGPGDELGDE